MSGSAEPAADVHRGRPLRTASRVGTAVCAVVLVVGHVVTAYVLLTAYMVEPDGPWDSQAVSNTKFAAGLGLAFSIAAALLTWVFVKAEWLRRWWYAIPAALALAALLRLTVLTPQL
ncbi:hypothetical protein [Streptomyces sp. NPDC085665]|uniref:hypothetical protein n=1 Tax=Streptomyces sp. NPDC085665 TaxID=3365735 RepID=UPI0037D44B86